MDVYRAKALYTSRQGVPSYVCLARDTPRGSGQQMQIQRFQLYVPHHFLPWSDPSPSDLATLLVFPENAPSSFCRCGIVTKVQLVRHHTSEKLADAALKIMDSWQIYVQRF
jgi:hypothetical protein